MGADREFVDYFNAYKEALDPGQAPLPKARLDNLGHMHGGGTVPARMASV